MDHYLEQAPIRNTPPVPVIFTKFLKENLKRNGPYFQAHVAEEAPKIDGDLGKSFWHAMANSEYSFYKLRDMSTGEYPQHLNTSVSFRWLPDNSALIVGIECLEPKMDKLQASCKDRDSMAIFNDDNVEIWLKTRLRDICFPRAEQISRI
jgi:hypothetical protein